MEILIFWLIAGTICTVSMAVGAWGMRHYWKVGPGPLVIAVFATSSLYSLGGVYTSIRAINMYDGRPISLAVIIFTVIHFQWAIASSLLALYTLNIIKMNDRHEQD